MLSRAILKQKIVQYKVDLSRQIKCNIKICHLPVGRGLGGVGGVIETVTALSKSSTETSDRSSAEMSKNSMPWSL